MNEGPDKSAPDTATDTTTEGDDLFAGIDLEGTVNFGGHPGTLEGHPEETAAVDQTEAETAPAESADNPDEGSADAGEDTPDPVEAVNFDGFDDQQRTFFETALKEGWATPDFVEEERKKTLMQSRFTKRMTEIKRNEEAIQAEREGEKELLGLLKNVLGDDQKHEALLRKLAADSDEDDDADEFADKRSAREIARAEAERIFAEKEQAAAQKQQSYQEKEKAVQSMLSETRETLGIDGETMVGYLKVLENELPGGVDPIAAIPPEDWRYRITKHHDIVTREAKIRALENALSKNKSKSDQAAKQSLPPSQRASYDRPMSLYEKTCADLGIDPTAPQVTGLGHQSG